jgi:ABC-type ATPase involved in cell division
MQQLAKEQESRVEPPKPPVLELHRVSFQGRLENGLRLHEADLVLREGDLAIVQLDSSTTTREVTSMMQGLQTPRSGQVLFCKDHWQGHDYDRHFKMRSRIGRVFEGQAWIENLNVDENVTLALRHHGSEAESIRQEIAYWVSKLELRGLSRKRPAFVEPSLLQVHQWIRAFAGSPTLLLLERPLQFLSSSWLPKLLESIDELRQRGAAVLWFTSEEELVPIGSLQPLMRLKWQEGKLVPVDGGSPT